MSPRARTLWTFAVTAVALLMVTLDNLVVVTALPVIRADLGASLEGLEWTVNAYTLTFAVLLLTGAALGDRFGRRRLFVIGLAMFTGASAAAALSGSIESLDRGPGGPGRRRRGRGAAHPDAPERGRARGAPRPGPRRLGRRRRPRHRARAGDRRRDRRGHQLALDLLAQRAHRHRPHPPRATAPDRESGPVRPARPARARARQRRPAGRRVGPHPRQSRRLDEPRRDRLRWPSASSCSWPSWPGSDARPRRCCRCASSAAGRSRWPTWLRC